MSDRDSATCHPVAEVACSLIAMTANTAKFAKGMKRAAASFRKMNGALRKAKSYRRRGENQQGYFRGTRRR